MSLMIVSGIVIVIKSEQGDDIGDILLSIVADSALVFPNLGLIEGLVGGTFAGFSSKGILHHHFVLAHLLLQQFSSAVQKDCLLAFDAFDFVVGVMGAGLGGQVGGGFEVELGLDESLLGLEVDILENVFAG